MPFDNDHEELSSVSEEESEVQTHPAYLIERAETCHSFSISSLKKAEHLKNTVTQKLSEKYLEWHKLPSGAELLRINSISETCRKLLKKIDEIIKVLKRQECYFQCLLKSKRLSALSGNWDTISRHPENLKSFEMKGASVHGNECCIKIRDEIESAETEIKKAVKSLEDAERKYYCECEVSEVKVLSQAGDIPKDDKLSIYLQDYKKTQNQPSSSKQLSSSNTLEDERKTDTGEKSSSTKRSAWKEIPEEKDLLVEVADLKQARASEIVCHAFKTETVQRSKNLPDVTDLDNVSKISDIQLEESAKQNKPFNSENLNVSNDAEDETDAQEKVSTKVALVEEILENPQENQILTVKSEASNGEAKLNAPLISDESDSEIDRNEGSPEIPEEPDNRNDAIQLEDIPEIVDDAVGGGRWVREILEHHMNPEPEEELDNLVERNPQPEVDLEPHHGRWVREILRRQPSND